ncbi:MAG TPA: tetratricopeptide repeat protein [Pyrinomonadaceae bacterium]
MSSSRPASSAHPATVNGLKARPRRARVSRVAVAVALAAVAFLLFTQTALAQISGTRAPVGGLGGEHEIYGEFKVDESKAREKVPSSFVLVLKTNNGRVVARQSALLNSTFRFFGLRDGEYEIVVESVGMPIASIPLLLNSSRKQTVKQDIMLEWVGGGGSGGKMGAVSAAEYYERTPANGELFGRAEAAFRKKKYKEALPLLQQLVAADARDHVAWAYLGAAHSSLGDEAESERSYLRALTLRPDLLVASVNLGRLYIAAKSFDHAVAVLKPAAEKHPDSADANFLLAESYLQTGKYDESANFFKEALRLDPKGKAEAHLRLALLFNAAGRKEEAAAELKQFLDKNPSHPNREKFEEYIRQNRKR